MDRRAEQHESGGACGRRMKSALGWASIGALAMYILDPVRGTRRRALMRDKLVHWQHQASNSLRKAGIYAGDQMQGISARAHRMLHEEQITDEQLQARVRATLGRAVSHPRSIEVHADQGQVTLVGPVLASEVDRLIRTVARVRGVLEVHPSLEVHETPDNVPALQGGLVRPERRWGIMNENWSPTARWGMGVAGAGLTLWSLRKPSLARMLAGTIGAAAVARSWTNRSLAQLVSSGADDEGISIHKIINIRQPIEKVWEFWSNYSNFPRFMSNVLQVQDHGDGRSHWVVAGPAGSQVEWDAQVTSYEPPHVLGWRSVEGSPVQNWGLTRLSSNPDGSTRVDIHLHYKPPAGVLGHFIARVFGADPKSEMDADLARLKTMLETGHTPRDAAQPTHGSERAAS